jgi:hypothetical protein
MAASGLPILPGALQITISTKAAQIVNELLGSTLFARSTFTHISLSKSVGDEPHLAWPRESRADISLVYALYYAFQRPLLK